MFYLGIDPGVSGGFAVINDAGAIVWAIEMPATTQGKVDLMQRALGYGPLVVALERVHSSPQMGVVSAFTFGRGYGQLELLVAAAGCTWLNPTPQTWQKAMACRTKGDKNVSKRAAQRLHYGTKVTHSIADALLLAEFARRHHREFLSRSSTTTKE